ncbi:uncharacterized protein BX664DRAFT_309539 [Halteromyces radiatus]|uniref:uncharacterized protein n=1 Tax=Halteromyces radiatus TaxID=101107 RepID=UPI00221E679F|nr:uncharacterized protein BX664DRAFT_309539 [Halteromyces radiatus]KAI8098471.1 hypothetical protein BX664DRAFT_309539 [Halteromyces radiatus]
MSTEEVDLKALSNTLSNSYSTLLQYESLDNNQILHHLDLLSTYSNHLPLSWFTQALIRTLLQLETQLINEPKGWNAIYSLLSVWTRRLSGTTSDVINKEPLLVNVLSLYSNTLLTYGPNDTTTLNVRKQAWMGLVALVGCTPISFNEEQLLTTMTKVIRYYSEQQLSEEEASMVEVLEAGVAHALAKSTTLNVFEMEYCQDLLEALISLETHRPHGVWSIVTLLEHAVDIRSQLKPTSRADADLDTLYTLAETLLEEQNDSSSLPVYFATMAILVGIVRMLQFNQGEKTKKVQGILQKAQVLFIQHFDRLLSRIMTPEESMSFSVNQDIIAYFSGQCLPNLTSDTMKTLNLKTLLQVLISSYSTSDHLWKNGQIIRPMKDETILVDLQKDPLFKEIGRISRSIGKTIQVLLEQRVEGGTETIQLAIDRLEALSYNIFIDWDRYTSQNDESMMTIDESKRYKKIESNLWTIFKTMVFAYTAILKAVAVDVLDGQGLIDVPHAAQGILSIYGNLHFINDKLGSANGFQAYQETMTNSVAYLKHDENKWSSLYTSDQTPSTSILSPVQRTRLLFFMNLAEQVMTELEDEVIEKDILPVIYPILRWKTIIDKDLFESAHAATLGIFSSQKAVSRELAGGYATILINSFPTPLTHHQIRLAYVTMVQSLCELDDAVAWLTVQHVLEKINQLSNEKDASLRSEYVVLLIDLLKPLSLGPFFGKALFLVEKLIKQQETKGMQQSTLKIVYETVSGSGISDMRRVEAVGWYLELKRQLKL